MEKQLSEMTDKEQLEYYIKNKTTKYWDEMPEIRKILNRMYYKKNKDTSIKEYIEQNKDKKKVYMKQYKQENKEKINERNRVKKLCSHCNKYLRNETIRKHLKNSI